MVRYTAEKKESIKNKTLTTNKSAEQIAAEEGVSASGVRNFWRDVVFQNNRDGYNKRVQAGVKRISPEQIKKIEHLSLTTKYPAVKIATLTNTSESFVLNTQRNIIFKDNPEAHKKHSEAVISETRKNQTERVKPDLTKADVEKISQKIRDTDESLRSICKKSGISRSDIQPILKKVFANDPDGLQRRVAQ